MKLPLAPFERMLREQGAEYISADATEALRKEVESYAMTIAELSVAMAKHAGRKTVKDVDVKIVVR